MGTPILPKIPPLKLSQAIRVKFSTLSVDSLRRLRTCFVMLWDPGASTAADDHTSPAPPAGWERRGGRKATMGQDGAKTEADSAVITIKGLAE